MEAILRDGVLIQAGGGLPGAAVCGYDVARGTYAGTVPANANAPGTVTIFGDDQVFVWAGLKSTGHGGGEMPRMPTRWIENNGRVIAFHVSRVSGVQ
jgi:hypothetical protein